MKINYNLRQQNELATLLVRIRRDVRDFSTWGLLRFDEWQLIGERLECPVISPVAFHFNQFEWQPNKPVICTQP